MGTRIKKILGYGLSDVEADGYELKDERINPESPLLGSEMKMKDYLTFLKGRNSFESYMERSMISQEEHDDQDLRSVLTWDPEYGVPNVLVITPLGYTGSWKRYDDSIDYAEHFMVKDASTDPVVHEITSGLFPYSGYMDRITGEKTDTKVHFWKTLLASDVDESVLEAASLTLGYESTGQAVDRIVPLVPLEVKMIAEFGKLFRDPDAWKQLRPMIYTLFS